MIPHTHDDSTYFANALLFRISPDCLLRQIATIFLLFCSVAPQKFNETRSEGRGRNKPQEIPAKVAKIRERSWRCADVVWTPPPSPSLVL